MLWILGLIGVAARNDFASDVVAPAERRLQSFFEDEIDFSCQSYLPLGVVRSDRDSQPRVCTLCSVLPWARRASHEEICRLDVSNCTVLQPGEQCTIRCREPYFAGDSITATCPWDNSEESGGGLTWEEPDCDIQCPDFPGGRPDGYVLDETGIWQCAPGYIGQADYRCTLHDDCVARPSLSGCTAMVHCLAPFDVDLCMLNLSTCYMVLPGRTTPGSCELGCNAPNWAGEPTIATCPAGNTDPFMPLNWTMPQCEPSCPPGTPVPDGYILENGQWRCAETHYGTPQPVCLVNDDCVAEWRPSGCDLMHPCVAPDDDLCRYNMSQCLNVPPGGSCIIRCREPFVGGASIASCVENNIDPNQELTWTPPRPSCALLLCPELEVVPVGYERHSDGWRCAAGYAGEAKAFCEVQSTSCFAETVLSGCALETACWPMDVDECIMDASDCTGVPPGASCFVRCKAPYEGTPGLARCPEQNTDPWAPVLFSGELPNCSLPLCPDPVVVPSSYARVDGQWRCAPGYAGRAQVLCRHGPDCQPSPGELAGCGNPSACAAPSSLTCSVDMSDCATVLPGQTCRVQCASPFVGQATVAECPLDNLDPAGLRWRPPDCTQFCPDPDLSVVPAGYYKTGAGWACALGYRGTAEKICSMDERCMPTATVLEGCYEEVPCATLPQQAACGFDVSECAAVPAGGSCEVRCKAPFFVGPTSEAFCPNDNTDPQQRLSWMPQMCEMTCPPATSQEGYVWRTELAEDGSDTGRWVCAPGWTGQVAVVCSMENCDVSPSTLTGCVRLQGCTVPEADPCLYTFECGTEGPGDSCLVLCRSPYVGQATVAVCPAGNTEVQPLEWTPPNCQCPDPTPIPEGYLKSEEGWHCAPGFIGQAVKSCNSSRGCFTAPRLWGCAQVHGCLPVELDNCEYDFSNCSDVQSGESCEIKCNPPYVLAEGSNGHADCPANNVNRFQRMTWTLPMCRLDCPEINPVPLAYERVNGSWVCAAGYAGSVQVDCYLSSFCSSEPSLQGCNKEEPCFPIALDRCVFDTSSCGSAAECQVACRAPYEGTRQLGRCPQGNTVPNLWPSFSLPDCELPTNCVDPLPIPVGYVKTAEGWRCDTGYSGTVHVQCVLGDSCEQLQPVLTGCLLIQPCKLPPVDLCIYDLGGCGDGSVPHGTSCMARCRLPYNGTVTAAYCPEGNTDPNQVLIWTQPQCELVDCLDPMPIPPGYIKLLDGGWSCATGYTGVVNGCCQFNDICMPRLTLSGCYPVGPCAMPSYDVCQFDLNDCPTTPLGFSCSIRCQFPYDGTPSEANCSEGAGALPPSERTLKMPAPRCSGNAAEVIVLPQQLYYTLPGCFCPDPFTTPDGYEKNGTVWQCARGYAGDPVLLCQDGDVCLPEPTLRGCFPLQQCKEPDIDPADLCRYDISDCIQYPPRAGQTCIIRCLAPYEGTFGFAGCPADNTVFNRSSVWLEDSAKPVCELNCPDPSDVPFGFIYIMPEGYMKDDNNNWMCAPGYAGSVYFYCAFGPNCTLINEPAGCLPFALCNGMITTTALDNCSLDTSLCDGIGPGVACNIHCKPPYVGPPGEAICPFNNTDPLQQVEWVYLPACYCPDTCQEQEGYLKIVEDPSIYFRRLFHLGAADAAGPFKCAEGWLGSPLLECRTGSECFDEVTLFGCDEIKPCIAPSLAPHMELPMGPNSTEPLPFLAEAQFAASNLSAVVPWVPGAQEQVPEHCMYDVSDCFRVDVASSCQVSCLWPLLPAVTLASCPAMNIQANRRVDWQRPQCVLGQCVDPNPLPEGMEKTSEGYRCALGYAGEIMMQCLTSDVREGCGTQAVPGGCQKMQSCSAPVADPCSHDVSDCANVPTGGSCIIRCRFPFSGFSTVGSCPSDNTIENRPVDWTPQECLSSACPIPRVMPEGYAIGRDGSFICARGYMGLVTTSCSHNPNNDCVANDLSFQGCVPSRSCNRCLDPDPLPPGYVWHPDTQTWHCAVGYRGVVAERCDSCTQPVILGGCVPLVGCLPPQVDRCVFDALDCWDLPSGQECQVFIKRPFVGNNSVARCPTGNTDFAQEAIWDGSIDNASCPDPVPPDGYIKVNGEWTCDLSTHRGTAELRCQAPDRCLREPELVGCRSLRACVPPDLWDPCAVASNCDGTLPGEDCNVTCRAPYVGDYVVASCDADNIQMNAKVKIDALPQCTLSCPDPPVTPEGYAKVDGDWQCAEGYGGIPLITCVRASENPADCSLNITMSGCLPLVSCSRPVVDACSTYVPDDCNFTAGSSCYVFCGENFRMEGAASFPQIDWGEDLNASDVPDWFRFGDAVPYAIATCLANNTQPGAAPLWNPAPRCVLECPYPSVVPPGYSERQRFNRWRCDVGYTGAAVLDCTLWENCSVTSWLSGCNELVPCALPAVEDPCVYDFEYGNCSSVMGGGSCEVQCKWPYAGPSTATATCPDLNIDPKQPLLWDPPMCNYTCIDPDPIPAGYLKATAAQISFGAPEWICAPGYSGEAVPSCNIDQNCVAIIALSGCLPIVPCKMPDVDTCMFDLSGCTAMLPGQFCFVGCAAPYAIVGDTTFASCPATNTDPNYVMDWTPPVCDCPGPTTLPAGYSRSVSNSLTSYACLSGYVGDAVVNCSVMGESCFSQAQFEGCIPTVPCQMPTVDACRTDLSACGSEVAPGASCTVSCGVYVGNSTTATCAQTNTDPNGLVIPADFQCDCPEPSTIPTGYARAMAGGWQCAAGYVGEVVHSCRTDASCNMYVELSGCDQLQPCESLVSNCLYDASNCTGVMPGESCDIFCEAPYVGTPTVGTCPQGNIMLNTSLDWRAPVCNHSVCPTPEFQSVDGFTLTTVNSVESWQCASGYGGQAVESCPIHVDPQNFSNCSSDTVLVGCLPVVGCVKPSADECVYNTSECDNLGPGQFCVLRCQTNYEGTATGGLCLASNTNPNRLVEWTRPSCRMVCPDPVPMPAGYQRNSATGFLECAPGYWGSANSFCARQFPGCEIETTLFGCFELFPCIWPEIDPCIYDYNRSVQLWGGESLTIQCKRPYRGFQSEAMCPPNNLDPQRPFLWFPGECFCPDPCPIPPGYFKTSAGYDNWICGQGYTGTSRLHCGSQGQCQEVPLLSGCTKTLPCARLNLTDYRCDVELLGCENLQPGQSCSVACAVPYVGTPVTALCPQDNSDENAQPVLQGELNCVLDSCNATDEVPLGYVKTHEGWKCDTGYGGTPAVHCSFSPAGAFQGGRGCGLAMHPSGCEPLVPCVPPASLEGCKYDTSGCGSVLPGQECQLKCRKPYSGLGVFATCPADNTDPTQEVILPVGAFLDCDCPAPAAEFIPAGYTQNLQGDWVCGPGFAGTAVKRCERPDQCLEEPEFLGCLPLQPCIIPDVDTCMFDLSDCVNVMPGETCSIYCVPPYKQEQVQNATCRPENTDPLQPIEWEIGRCDLDWEDCVDPLPLPVGYEKRFDGFHCAAGYVGVAEVSPTVHCGPWAPNCDSTPKLTGCFPLESCRPVRFEDDCAYDTSQCPDDFKPGDECQVPCKVPYVGAASVARCSSKNIDWQGAFEWTASTCTCPPPRTVPEGYFQNASGWFCDSNNSYTGQAEVVCSQPGFCLTEPTLIGCQRAGPCVAPLLDHCMFDASSCEGVEISRQCVISCAAGFLGASTTAFCENPGGEFGLQYTEPNCRLDFCPDPPVIPGYVRNTSGWFCAAGFEGQAVKSCSHDGSCQVFSRLSGCSPIRIPCGLPATLDCRYDLSNCSGISPGKYCEVKCAAPFAGKSSTAVCPPGNGTQQPEELLLTLPYCDLEACPDPDPIPVGYRRVGEVFVCTEGFVGQAIMQCRQTQSCQHVLDLSGCTNATEIAVSLTQLQEAPSQLDFVPCQAQEACGEPDEVPAGYDKFLGEWRCAIGYSGSAGIQCSPRRNCQSTPTLSGCVPIEACLPIIADGCDIDVSDCRNVLGGESCEVKCKDPYTGASTFATCPEGNINTSQVLTWTRPNCELTNCPQGLRVQDGYIKDSILGWICANGFKGIASVNCSIEPTTCMAECVYGGCVPIEVCMAPAADACQFNLTGCDGILPGRSCEIGCMPPYFGASTVANCRATAPWGPNLTSTSPPELEWTQPICQCPEALPAPGYQRVIDAPAETWQCDEGFGGAAIKQCQRPLECLDAPELFGCLPLQPCVPPVSTDRCPSLDLSNCSEVPPGESCEVLCVPPFIGAPSIASCPAENLVPNQVLTMPVEPCVLGCEDPPVHPGYRKVGEDWRCDTEDRFSGTAKVFCELDQSCGSVKKFEGCIPITRPCQAPPLDLCEYDVSDCVNVAPGGTCFIRCAGNYVGPPVEANCPAGNMRDNGLNFTVPRCVVEDLECPLPAVLPEGYALHSNGRDVVCDSAWIGSFVSYRCGHDVACNKVLEFTGCVKPVKCAPLKIEPCERDNLGCWDVEAGASCSIECKPPFFGQSSLATCAAGNTDPTTPLEYQLTTCLCSDPPVIPNGFTQDIFGQWSCEPGYAGAAVKRCRVGEICIPDSELVGCQKLEPCRDLTPTSCDQDVSDCTNVQPGGNCFVTCRQPWTSIESTLGVCPDNNVDPLSTVTWTPPTCELRCPRPDPMPIGFEWNDATGTATCQQGYLGPASTVCIINNMTCEVTTIVSGCQKLMPCVLPPVDQCRVNMTQCRDVMPGESCRPRCIPPFELYGPAALARCPENNLLPDTELEWVQFPNCSVFECEDPAPVPAGYIFGINENDPVAVGEGVPRWYCAPGYVGTAERVCSGNATCGVIAFLSGCLPIIACRAPVVDTCRVDDSRCASIRPGSRCILSCRPPFEGPETVASCSVRNTQPDGLLFRSPRCTLPDNFDPIPLDIGFSSTFDGFRCGVGYAGRIQTVCRMQAGCRTTTYPVGCAPPVTCKVAAFQDEDGRRGFVAGNISFGRAQLDTMLNAGEGRDFRSNTPLRFSGKGTIYEDEIDSYDVYFADSCNRTVGDVLTSVRIKDATDQILCCDESVYNVSLTDLQITEEVRGIAIVAKIRNSLGLEPSVNYWVVTFEDRIDPITNAALQMTYSMVFWLLGALSWTLAC